MARLVLMGKRAPLIHLAGSRSSEPGNGQQLVDLGPVLEVGVPESLLQIRFFPDDPLLEDEVRHQGCNTLSGSFMRPLRYMENCRRS